MVPADWKYEFIQDALNAIDVATAARRLGAERVTIAYRRGEDAMPAFAYEYELAKTDGVRFEWFAQPVRVVAEGGAACGVEFVRTTLADSASRQSCLTGSFRLPSLAAREPGVPAGRGFAAGFPDHESVAAATAAIVRPFTQRRQRGSVAYRARDVFEMRRLAADDAAERHNSIVLHGLRRALDRERDLE